MNAKIINDQNLLFYWTYIVRNIAKWIIATDYWTLIKLVRNIYKENYKNIGLINIWYMKY
jgi:hypothetical protein